MEFEVSYLMSRFRTDPLSARQMPATLRKRIVKRSQDAEAKAPGAQRTQDIPTYTRPR